MAVGLTAAVPLRADDRAPSSAGAAAAGPWTVQFVGDVYREAWDYNLSDEDLFGAAAAALYRVNRRWSVGLETMIFGVHQERVPSVAVGGVAPLVRWHRLKTRGSYFAEGGGGVTYATGIVPELGTRLNYISPLGVGLTRTLGSGTTLVGSIRWLHLSNNSLAGRSRNPDIQAIGLRAGVVVPLLR